MALAHLALAALGGGDIHHLATACPLSFHELHTMFAGVEISQTIVVPQDAIALVGEQHGYGDLCVDLCESSRQAAHVAVAVLELAESEQTFVLGRGDGQACLFGRFAVDEVASQLVACGGEHYVSCLVAYCDDAFAPVDADAYLCTLHFFVVLVNPVG